ncbi:glycosyltransferase family 2 protein [bacterium]|nr:glycosyltransferase family 2 protein [bacterium]
MTYGAILPALNAARFLPDVIGRIRAAQPDVRVLVVDDGSSDGTADAARAAGAEVAVHEVNKGKGEALKTGYAWAQRENLAWVFTMDSDGQHLPEEMQGFRDAADQGGLDVVVGTRMAATADMPWLRKMTNLFTSWVISRLAGCEIPDSQNGYRLYRVACFAGLVLRTSRYDSESEILVRLARRGHRIGSAPITTVYGDEVSSINPFVDTGRFFRLVFMLLTSRE